MSPRNSLAAALGKTLERDRAGGAIATGPGEAETAYPRRSLPVQLAQIRVADRLRLALDEATVATLAASMEELGLQSPVLLRPWRAAGPEGSDAWGREDAGLFALVAGAHRLEAARRLGWTHIEAMIVEGTPDEVRLIEIDENLARAELTVLDRARFLATRKRIHERMYPAQHRGGDRKSIDYAGENQSAKFALRSFSHDAMAHTGLSRRANWFWEGNIYYSAQISCSGGPFFVCRRGGHVFPELPGADAAFYLQLLRCGRSGLCSGSAWSLWSPGTPRPPLAAFPRCRR